MDLRSVERILIVKPSSLGDIVQTLPLLWLLRRECPRETEIHWLVNTAWSPLLRGHDLLDGVIEFPRHEVKGLAGAGRFLDWARQQRDLRPDLAIDVQGLLRSAFLGRVFRPGRFTGYSDAREGAHFFHDEAVDAGLARSPHAVDRYLTFFQALGVSLPEVVEFPLPPGEEPSASWELPPDFVLLHPFSRGAGKSCTADQVKRFCEAMAPLPVVLAGQSEEPPPLDAPNVVNLLNRTSLSELIGLLRRSRWVVSVDSGPMHLAAAITPRVLSIHTWSDPAKVGPYPADAWVWKDDEILTAGEFRDQGRDLGARRGDGSVPDAAIDQLAGFVASRWEED